MSKNSNASLSVALRTSQSLNWNDPKRPCSIRLLLHIRGGATRTASQGSSHGIATSLD